MESLFLFIYNFFSKHKILLWGILIAICAPVFFYASKIKLEEDITKVLPGGSESQEYQQILKQSGLMEKLVVRIAIEDSAADPDPEKLIGFAAAFENQLLGIKEAKPLVKEIRGRIPDEVLFKAYRLFHSNLPFFLDEKDYKTLDTLTTDSSVVKSMERNYHTIMSPMSMILKEQIKNDPLHLTTLALAKLQSLQVNSNYELYDGYIINKDRKSLLLIITPSRPPNETATNKILIDAIDEVTTQLETGEFKGVNAEYFGSSAVAVANAKQIQKDIRLTITLAVLSICVLLWWYFRKALLPIVLLFPIAFGAAFALAIIYLMKQSISSIALGGGAVVVGIAVNYSMHVFTHYKHTGSIKVVIKDLSVPMLVGNISTVAAFMSLLFVKSDVLSDFGLFAGLCLVGAILFTLLFLPHLLALYEIKSHHHEVKWIEGVSGKVNVLGKNIYKYAAILIFVLSLVFYFTYENVGFETDLNSLNYMSDDLKKAEKNLNSQNNQSERMVYLLFKGDNLNEALIRNEQALGKINALLEAKTASRYFGVTPLLTSDSMQQKRLALWQKYWTEEKKASVKKNLDSAAALYGFKASTFDDFYGLLNTNFTALSDSSVNEVKQYFLKDYISTSIGDTTVLIASLRIPVSQGEKVYETFQSDKDLYILDKQYIIKKFLSILEKDFNQIVYTTSLVVFVILLIFYGRIELAVMAFFPMLVSWLWILGFMNIFDLRFNIVNIIICTFIFGLGDDYTIFMMDGLLGEHKTGSKNLPSYKTSILLSAITTLLGMGVLLFAEHPALESIALVSVLGIVCVLFISYTLIPILFKAIITNRVKRGLAPLTIVSFLKSVLAFAYFFIGCIILTVVGVVIFKILRVKKGKLKLTYHYLIMYFVRTLLFSFSSNRKFKNDSGVDFSKPSIIVANHQSFLDILKMLSFSPRVVLMTKDWVWNSIVMGPVVRMAGFMTASKGVENNFEVSKAAIEQGYSIVIFPEGSRSEDCEIKRFHKGAFFLAEELKLDIIPVVLHGTGYCMPKNDYFLQPFDLSLTVLPEISHGSVEFGTNYQEKTKKICKYMREEYQKIRDTYEDGEFFYQKLVQHYIYKSPDLEWYMRIKLRLEKYYKTMHEIVPLKGRIYDVGCGYGFMSYMLAYRSSEREIIGVDYDENKIEVAAHCKSGLTNVSFYSSDAIAFDYKQANAFVISDVLHYISKESQFLLIKKCIENLSKGGVLIIRDADNSLQERHLGTKISEFFSVKFIGFNKSDNKQLYFFSSKEMLSMLNQFDVEVKIIDQTKLNSNIIYYIKKLSDNGIK